MLDDIGLNYISRGIVKFLADNKKFVDANRAAIHSVERLRQTRTPGGQFGPLETSLQRVTRLQQPFVARMKTATAHTVHLDNAFKRVGTTIGQDFPRRLARAAYFLGRMQFVIISTVAALALAGAPVIFAAKFEEQMARIAGLTDTPKEAIAG